MSWFSSKDDALAKSDATAAEVSVWQSAIGTLANMSGPIREQDVIPVVDALQRIGGLSAPEASALASWLGGYAHSTSFLANAFELGDPGVYMDVENLNDQQNGTTVVIGDALRALRTCNPAAHAWVIDRAIAKRDKKQIDSDTDLEQHRLKVVNTEIRGAETAAAEAVKLPEAALTGLESLWNGVSRALSSPWLTMGIVLAVVLLVGGLYLALQSRLARALV